MVAVVTMTSPGQGGVVVVGFVYSFEYLGDNREDLAAGRHLVQATEGQVRDGSRLG
jgi:hypothetical protein